MAGDTLTEDDSEDTTTLRCISRIISLCLKKVEKPYQVIEGHNLHIHYLFIKTQVLSNLIKNQLCYSTCMLQSKLYISNIFT